MRNRLTYTEHAATRKHGGGTRMDEWHKHGKDMCVCVCVCVIFITTIAKLSTVMPNSYQPQRGKTLSLSVSGCQRASRRLKLILRGFLGNIKWPYRVKHISTCSEKFCLSGRLSVRLYVSGFIVEANVKNVMDMCKRNPCKVFSQGLFLKNKQAKKSIPAYLYNI